VAEASVPSSTEEGGDEAWPAALREGWAKLPWGLRQWVTWGTAASVAMVVFGMGLLVGRCTAKPSVAQHCPEPVVVASRGGRVIPEPAPGQPDPTSTPPAGVVKTLPITPRPPAPEPRPRPVAGTNRGSVSEPDAAPSPAPDAETTEGEPGEEDDEGYDDEVVEPWPPKPKAAKRAPRKKRKERDRSDLKELLRLAQEAYVAGKHDMALAFAKRALKKDPRNEYAWQIVGAASCYIGLRQQAMKAFNYLPQTRRRLLKMVCYRNGISL
jgi:hypothetical protein